MTILTDHLADTHVESRPTFGSGRRDPRLAQALQRFFDAHVAADQACADLTRAQLSGPDPLPRHAAFLLESANSAYQEALALAGKDTEWVEAAAESQLGAATMRGYAGRRRPSGHVVTPRFSSWEESIGKTNWSRGRAA